MRHLLATISAAPDPELLGPLVVPEAWRREAESALAALGADDARPLLVLHPGAGGRWKRWPAGEMAAAVEQALDGTDAQALVHEGPADADAAAELAGLLRRPTQRLVAPA